MVEKKKSRLEFESMLEEYPGLKQILHSMKQVVWLVDRNSDEILYVNPAFEVIWGRSCESFYGDPLTLIESIHPEDRVKVMSIGLDENRTSVTQTYRIVRSDGSPRWISAHTFLMDTESADTTYQVSIAQDITAQNQIDETLQKALDRSREQFTLSRRMSLARKPEAVLKTLMYAAELRTARRAFVLFFESTPADAALDMEVLVSWSSAPNPTNPSGNVTANEAILIEDLALLDLFHPSKPVIVSGITKDERITPVVRDLLREGQIQSVVTFPLVALGSWLGCLLVFYPQETQFESIVLRHIKVMVDQAAITLYNLRLLEIEAESRQEAERANEIKTKFLAMISHELRTPLTSIKGFTTTMLAEDVAWEPDEQRDFLQTIEQEANRLQELIDHLLDLSRLEAGMLPITLEAHALQEIIDDALPQIQTLTSGHKVTFHVPVTLPPVYVDAKRIAQVLVNLVRNAATYSPKATEIYITAHWRKGFVQINVIDQGPGIPRAEHTSVFRAFQRGAQIENSTMQGAGLGLAICKGLVEAHGGRIWIKKKTTPGATISFTIPIVPLPTPLIRVEEE